jgi:hypothetical protein
MTPREAVWEELQDLIQEQCAIIHEVTSSTVMSVLAKEEWFARSVRINELIEWLDRDREEKLKAT